MKSTLLFQKVCGLKNNPHLCSAYHLRKARRLAKIFAAGIFYVHGYTYSSVPCGALMRPLPMRCKTTGSDSRFSVYNAKKRLTMATISIQGAPTPNGHHVTTSLILRLVNVCIAFIALTVSGSADILFPLFASMGWFISSIVYL